MQSPDTPARVPRPVREWATRLQWDPAAPDVRQTIDSVTTTPDVIEEFQPLCKSLEWRIAEHHWALAGVLPFVDNEVPFLINNSGRLSENAAVLLFENCSELEPNEQVTVIELGAGTGLFARFFLDSFRTLCQQEGKTYYERLRYVVTDRSTATVEHWRERDLFATHATRVVTQVCDASRLDPPIPNAVRAVICNYVLDVLPSAIVRRSEASAPPEQLCVRTHLTRDRALRSNYTTLGSDEIRALAQRGDADAMTTLASLTSLFEYEVAMRASETESLPYLEAALGWNPTAPRVLLNFGALACLDGCFERLAPGGFILINDYGSVTTDQMTGMTAQRFGMTTALGLNFSLIEQFGSARRAHVYAPPGDEERTLHARLLTLDDLPRTTDAFSRRFSADAYAEVELPAARARVHASAGRTSEALDGYRTALSQAPRDWPLIVEVAEFVSIHLKDHAAAVQMCRAALELNPFYSAWLWNVLGDALFCLEHYEDSHEAYLQAERINPHDGRTNLNLAYTHLQGGRYQEALQMIARGLAADASGMYRDRLLQKQQHVLSTITSRWIGEQDRLRKRDLRFAAT
jgi:tetratricopeptide (TPR) repeat protein